MTQQPQNRWQHDGPEVDAWSAMSSVISGVLIWGAIGYGLSRWLGSAAWMGLGVVIGGVLGVFSVYLRYGRGQSGPPVTGGPVVFHGKTGVTPGVLPPEDATPVRSAPFASLPAQSTTDTARTAKEDTP